MIWSCSPSPVLGHVGVCVCVCVCVCMCVCLTIDTKFYVIGDKPHNILQDWFKCLSVCAYAFDDQRQHILRKKLEAQIPQQNTGSNSGAFFYSPDKFSPIYCLTESSFACGLILPSSFLRCPSTQTVPVETKLLKLVMMFLWRKSSLLFCYLGNFMIEMGNMTTVQLRENCCLYKTNFVSVSD